jgi:hypothetical protein
VVKKKRKKRAYRKQVRCQDCGRHMHRLRNKSNNKSAFCNDCKDARNFLNKAKHDKFRYLGKSNVEKAAIKAIKKYGISANIRIAIKKNIHVSMAKILKRAETTARLEARKATYGILLTLGAKAFFTQPDKKGDQRVVKTKMLREIEQTFEMVPEKPRRRGRPRKV